MASRYDWSLLGTADREKVAYIVSQYRLEPNQIAAKGLSEEGFFMFHLDASGERTATSAGVLLRTGPHPWPTGCWEKIEPILAATESKGG